MTDKDMPDEIYVLKMDNSETFEQRISGFWDLDSSSGTRYTRTDIHDAVVAERDELRAVIAEMKGALKASDKELDSIKDDAFCEHDVGICSCAYWSCRERNKKALAAAEKVGG